MAETSAKDLSDAVTAAKLALLKDIANPKTTGQTVLQLAEAYAWLVSPAQPH